MSYSHIGDAVTNLIVGMAVLIVIFVPLGLWKLIEIIVWLFKNVTITWGS